MISNSSKYAIKAVLFLALHSNEDHKIMVKAIAAPINVPKPYLAKLLQELAKRNLISSTRGPKGGFYLSNENKKRSILDIIEVIDGTKKINSCLLSLERCDSKNPCPIHHFVSKTKTDFLENLEQNSIADLALDVKNGKSKLPL